MSKYNASKWNEFCISNFNNIKKLRKFMHCNDMHDILETIKIKPKQIFEIYNFYNNDVIIYEPNKLTTFSSVKIQDRTKPNKVMDIGKFENIYNNINNLNYNFDDFKYEVYELFWKKEKDVRMGAMSMSSCRDISPKSRSNKIDNFIFQDVMKSTNVNSIKNYEKYVTNTSALPSYFGTNILHYGRIIKFKNRCKLKILNCNPDNYSGRFIFRRYITQLLLGDDYKFNFTKGVYSDGSLGQEIIYYIFEIYNYDRYHMLFKIYYDFFGRKINVNPNIEFVEFYNDEMINKIYPGLDGLYYYDQNTYTMADSMELNVHGTEILIFTPELIFNISKVIYLDIVNNKLTFKDVLTEQEMQNNLLNFIKTYSQKNQNIPMDIESFEIINKKMLEECDI